MEILLLVLGAGLGYVAGWLQKVIDDRRRRKAVATALSAEYIRIKSMLEYLVNKWRGGRAIADFSAPMHERLPDVVELFKPVAVARLLDFSGFLVELRRDLRFLNTVEHPEQRSRMIGEVRELAGNVLRKGELAQVSLLAAGAERLQQAPLSEIAEARIEK